MEATKPQITHRIALPLAWLVAALLLCRWQGDKGLAFYFGTFVGAWVPEIARLHGTAYLVGQCAGGFAVMVLAGWVLDRSRISAYIYLAGVPLVIWGAKNGFADPSDALMGVCLGLYLVGILGLLLAAIKWLRVKTARDLPEESGLGTQS